MISIDANTTIGMVPAQHLLDILNGINAMNPEVLRLDSSGGAAYDRHSMCAMFIPRPLPLPKPVLIPRSRFSRFKRALKSVEEVLIRTAHGNASFLFIGDTWRLTLHQPTGESTVCEYAPTTEIRFPGIEAFKIRLTDYKGLLRTLRSKSVQNAGRLEGLGRLHITRHPHSTELHAAGGQRMVFSSDWVKSRSYDPKTLRDLLEPLILISSEGGQETTSQSE